MRVIDKRPTFHYLSVLSFYISSFSIAFMPLATTDSENVRQGVADFLAVLFWLGLIGGIALTFFVRRQRLWDVHYKPPKRLLPPPFRFFSNKMAIVFDSLFIAGVIMLIVTMRRPILPQWVTWEILFLTIFSLEMHFIFNGKNYIWLKTPLPE